MIYLGSQELSSYLGTEEIGSIYLGSEELYSSGLIVDLGEGQTFNVASIIETKGLSGKIDFRTLSIDNFFIVSADSTSSSGEVGWSGMPDKEGIGNVNALFEKSYSNGSLVFRLRCDAHDRFFYQPNYRYGNVHAFLVLKAEKLRYLGKGQTFDLNSIPNFESLTVDDFAIKASDQIWYDVARSFNSRVNGSCSLIKSIDSGILTCKLHMHGTCAGISRDESSDVEVYLCRTSKAK